MKIAKTILMTGVLSLMALPALATDNPPHPAPAAEQQPVAATDKDAKPADKMDHKGWGLEKMDADGDGAISKQEFMAGGEKKFAELDSNSDGKIDTAEIEARRKMWKEKMENHHEGMMKNKETAPATEDESPKQ